MAQRICTTCGHIGRTKTITKGSILIELVLWLFFIIPGVIYSLWRITTRHKACRCCGSQSVIPLDSPMAQRFLKK